MQRDAKIRAQYLSAFYPISSTRVHAVYNRPANSFFNTSARGREYVAPPQIIPQLVGEQLSALKSGEQREREVTAMKRDLLVRAARAKNDASVLQPAVSRAGARQEDMGTTPLRSMSNSVSPKLVPPDLAVVGESLDDQAVGPQGVVADPNAVLALGARRAEEDLIGSARALKDQVARFLSPTLEGDLGLVRLMTPPPAGPFVLRRKGLRDAPAPTLSTARPLEQAQTFAAEPSSEGPPPEVPEGVAEPASEPVSEPTASETFGGQPLEKTPGGSTIDYADRDYPPLKRPSSKANKAMLVSFVSQHLKVKNMNSQKSKSFFEKLTKDKLLALTRNYFPKP